MSGRLVLLGREVQVGDTIRDGGRSMLVVSLDPAVPPAVVITARGPGGAPWYFGTEAVMEVTRALTP